MAPCRLPSVTKLNWKASITACMSKTSKIPAVDVAQPGIPQSVVSRTTSVASIPDRLKSANAKAAIRSLTPTASL